MKQKLERIKQLLDNEYQYKDELIPNNIVLIYEILEECCL